MQSVHSPSKSEDIRKRKRRYLRTRAEISADKSGDIHAQTSLCTRASHRLSSGIPAHRQADTRYGFLTNNYSDIIIQQTTFRAVRKDYRPARISPHHSRAHRGTKPEKEAKNKQKGLKIRQIGQFGFFPSLLLSFRSLFGLFQVLFKAYPETKKQKTGCGRERNQKKQSKILIIQHPSMPQILPTDLSDRS